MEIKGYTLLNEEKVERALLGTLGPKGVLIGGIQQPDGSYNEDALLAEYDKLGGAIKKGDDTVKTGSFYNFKAKKYRETPEVYYVFNINGRTVEIAAEEELPLIIKAKKQQDALDKEEKVKNKEKKDKKTE